MINFNNGRDKNTTLQLFGFYGICGGTFFLGLLNINIHYLSLEGITKILFTIPLAYIVLITLQQLKCRQGLIAIILTFLLVGTGIHLVGNHFNDHLYNIYQHETVLKDYAYFYDEIFSHYMIFSAYILFLILGTFKNANNKGVLPGILLGAGLALSVLEAQTAPLSLIAGTVVILVSYKTLKNQNFFSSAIITAAVLVVIWFMIFGSFVEPLEVVRQKLHYFSL